MYSPSEAQAAALPRGVAHSPSELEPPSRALWRGVKKRSSRGVWLRDVSGSLSLLPYFRSIEIRFLRKLRRMGRLSSEGAAAQVRRPP